VFYIRDSDLSIPMIKNFDASPQAGAAFFIFFRTMVNLLGDFPMQAHQSQGRLLVSRMEL
jgi:hypothetical protein